MPTEEINGTTLHYETVGEGPPALVLHGGLGLDHTYLRPELDRLGSRLRLVYVDQRGNGRSGRPQLETITMEQLADDADALAERLGLGRVVVVAHSFGTFVAQELALRRPGRVAALVLVAATAGQVGFTEGWDDDQGPPVPLEVDVLVRVPPASDEEAAATLAAVRDHFVRPDGAAAGRDPFAGVVIDAATMARSMHVLSAWSAVDRLEAISVPTLLVAGAHDVFASPPQSHRIARRVPGAEVAVLGGSAHLPWLDEPEAFFDCVETWLDRVLARR